jgi:hypothetical protein
MDKIYYENAAREVTVLLASLDDASGKESFVKGKDQYS